MNKEKYEALARELANVINSEFAKYQMHDGAKLPVRAIVDSVYDTFAVVRVESTRKTIGYLGSIAKAHTAFWTKHNTSQTLIADTLKGRVVVYAYI